MRFQNLFFFENRVYMNNSNAAAKRRRAGILPNTPPEPTPASTSSKTSTPTSGLTLPQVITVIDTRLVVLEKFMKESKPLDHETSPPNDAVFMDSKEFTEFVDDVNKRFQLFADEINNLKEIVLKLQSYTMDVNKMLLANLSNNGEPVPTISMDENGEDEEEEQTFTLGGSQSISEKI